MMHTESYCATLESLDRARAVRAIHAAYLQLSAAARGVEYLDHGPALGSLRGCLAEAGHAGSSGGARA